MTQTSVKQKFNYDQAFDRNLGWLTPEEQTTLAEILPSRIRERLKLKITNAAN